MAHLFPLLRLPYLAFEESIKLMRLQDQFALSKVSKRSRRVVKCVLRNCKYNTSFDFKGNVLAVSMLTPNMLFCWFNIMNLNDSTDMDLIKDSITQVTTTFAIEEISVEFGERHFRLMSVIIPFVKQLGLPYGVAVYTNDVDKKNDEIYEFILTECGDADTLLLKILTTPEFSPNPNDFEPLQCRTLRLYHSSWITIDTIIKWFMNCNHLVIFECNFTTTEINRLLKTWQKGSKIEHFALLYLWELDFPLEAVLDEISATAAQTVSVQQEDLDITTRRSGYSNDSGFLS